MSGFFRNSLYRPMAPQLAEVVEVRRDHHGFVSLDFYGEGLAGFPAHCPAAHVKLFFPGPGEEKPVLPQLSKNGPKWPIGVPKPQVRTYSVRKFDHARCLMTIEMSLHSGDGPAASFAARAQVGQFLGISHPGGPTPMLPQTENLLICGDSSSLPAVNALAESMLAPGPGNQTVRTEQREKGPGSLGAVLLQVPDKRYVRTLELPDGLRLEYILAPDGECGLMVDRLKELAPSMAPEFFWLAGEHQLVAGLRQYVRERYQPTSSQIYALPYWRLRLSEEVYHHQRDEFMEQRA